jgi:hypothetical protein
MQYSAIDYKALNHADVFCQNAYFKANINFRLYRGQGNADVRYLWDNLDFGYTQYITDESGEVPHDNVTKSVIDTLVSKLSQVKVREFFTPVKGNFKTKKVVRTMQKFFDLWFDSQDVKTKIIRSRLQSCIFGRSWLWVNSFNNQIQLLKPWNVGIIPAEANWGKIKHALLRFDYFPKALIVDFLGQEAANELSQALKMRDEKLDSLSIFYDAVKHVVSVFIDNAVQYQEKWDYDSVPLVEDVFYDPVVGCYDISVVDLIRPIQREIDNINDKIHECLNRTLANIVVTDSSGPVRKKDVVGGAIEVYEVPGGQVPFNVTTNQFVNAQYVEWLARLETRAYERVGISQLSAMSNKPEGLDSGVALQTYEDIESDRFQTQVNDTLNLYKKLAQACIAFFPRDAQILQDSDYNVKWADVVDEQKHFNIQFSAADPTSRDPATKVQQILNLYNQGLIPVSRVSEMMEMPDLDDAYQFSSSVYDGVQKVLENALERGNYELPEYISYEVLAMEIAQLQNQLFASDDPEDQASLERLNELDAALLDVMINDGVIVLGNANAAGVAASSVSNQGVQAQGATPEGQPQQQMAQEGQMVQQAMPAQGAQQ